MAVSRPFMAACPASATVLTAPPAPKPPEVVTSAKSVSGNFTGARSAAPPQPRNNNRGSQRIASVLSETDGRRGVHRPAGQRIVEEVDQRIRRRRAALQAIAERQLEH